MKGFEGNIHLASKVLERTYHSPRLGNKRNPLNELLYIQLSLRTTGPSFERVYKYFKKRFPKWEDAHKAKVGTIASALFNAGLSNQKAVSLKATLNKLKSDFGRISLAPLKRLPDKEIEHYLCSLPRIGKKSARCIMLYSFDSQVFPVDAHCFRIVRRLGWIDLYARYNDKIADEVQDIIPPSLRYSLHVNMVAHGRALCRDKYPKCKGCPVFRLCPYGQKRLSKRGISK